jgi:hypothetical protein
MLTKVASRFLVALWMAVMSCNTDKPDLCKGVEPTCVGNIATYCLTMKDCDLCSYYARTLTRDCDAVGVVYGVTRSCVVGAGTSAGVAVCVDSTMTPCQLRDGGVLLPGETCDERGYSTSCMETVNGPLLASCATCGCPGGKQLDASVIDGAAGN